MVHCTIVFSTLFHILKTKRSSTLTNYYWTLYNELNNKDQGHENNMFKHLVQCGNQCSKLLRHMQAHQALALEQT